MYFVVIFFVAFSFTCNFSIYTTPSLNFSWKKVQKYRRKQPLCDCLCGYFEHKNNTPLKCATTESYSIHERLPKTAPHQKSYTFCCPYPIFSLYCDYLTVSVHYIFSFPVCISSYFFCRIAYYPAAVNQQQCPYPALSFCHPALPCTQSLSYTRKNSAYDLVSDFGQQRALSIVQNIYTPGNIICSSLSDFTCRMLTLSSSVIHPHNNGEFTS